MTFNTSQIFQVSWLLMSSDVKMFVYACLVCGVKYVERSLELRKQGLPWYSGLYNVNNTSQQSAHIAHNMQHFRLIQNLMVNIKHYP